jgi:hypothetical protein
MKNQFFVEMTDTYGGEANYCWVNRFIVSASSELGAIRKVTRRTGYPARTISGCGRYDVPGACICYFVEWVDADQAKTLQDNYSRIEVF